ncbi:Hypothetical protein HDN1F_14920 [gamma proteobacterium HdN1]|nr:Hypothetical protein HDN1F_14920 [gamma proteobacterium HdN1]
MHHPLQRLAATHLYWRQSPVILRKPLQEGCLEIFTRPPSANIGTNTTPVSQNTAANRTALVAEVLSASTTKDASQKLVVKAYVESVRAQTAPPEPAPAEETRTQVPPKAAAPANTATASTVSTSTTSTSTASTSTVSTSTVSTSIAPASAAPEDNAVPEESAPESPPPSSAATEEAREDASDAEAIDANRRPTATAEGQTSAAATKNSNVERYVASLLLNAVRSVPAQMNAQSLEGATLEKIAQGQVVRLQVTLPLPLLEGSTLSLELAANSPPRLLNVVPLEGLPLALRSSISAALAGQASPEVLLRSLQTVLNDPALLEKLPPRVALAAQQLLSRLADFTALKQPGEFLQQIQKGGLFWESSLAKLIHSALQSASIGGSEKHALPNGSTASVAGKTHLGALLTEPESTPRAVNSAGEKVAALGTFDSDEKSVASEKNPSAAQAGEQTPASDTKGRVMQQVLRFLRTQLQSPQAGDSPHTQVGDNTTEKHTAEKHTVEKHTGSPLEKQIGEQMREAASSDFKAGLLKLHRELSQARASMSESSGEKLGKEIGELATQVQTKSTEAKGSLAELERAGKAAASLAASSLKEGPSLISRAVSQYQQTARLAGQALQNPTAGDELDFPSDSLDSLALNIPGMGLPLPHLARGRQISKNDRMEDILSLLLKRTQQSIDRIHLQQLANAGVTPREQAHAPAQMSLSFDLPILFGGHLHTINARIEEDEVASREDASVTKKVRQWTVSLGFDLEGLGPMFCQLQMVSNRASLQFWAEQSTTLALTRSNMDFLTRSLGEMGVSLDETRCHEGMPKQTQVRFSQQLVDIST